MSQHHTFDVELATIYGIEEAIIIHHFQHWVSFNKRLKRNFIEGRTWTFQTQEEIAAHFPYLNRDKVRRTIDILVEKKVLLKSNFNKLELDKTIWYAFNNEELFTIGKFAKSSKTCSEPESDPESESERFGKNANSIGKNANDIPHTNTTYTGTTNPTLPKESAVGGSSIYDCLKELPLKSEDKVRLSLYSEELVKKAIKYASRPGFTPDSLDSYLFHLCAKPEQIRPLKEDVAKQKQDDHQQKIDDQVTRRKYAEEIQKVLWTQTKAIECRLIPLTDYFEISCDRWSEKIYYKDKSFRNQVTEYLKKLNLNVPEFTKNIP